MNNRKQIDTFIDGVKRYFTHLDNDADALNIGVPYLVQNDEALGKDFTGLISVSGSSKGYVMFTANRTMFSKILLKNGESQFSDRFMGDLAGEVANTIAGNARSELGSEFDISTPQVVIGKIDSKLLQSKRRSYVLPLRWKSNGAELIISLEAA